MVGNAQDMDLQSGVTVLTSEQPLTAAVDIRGGAPGARETALLDPACTVDQIHAITLSGGSAWGLNAADGVMTWLKEQGRGVRFQNAIIPIVPTSILFDLNNGGNKEWENNPYCKLGYMAAANSKSDFDLGTVGAGTGAKAGHLKGGLGSASFTYKDQFSVGALIAANPIGSVVMPNSPYFWAWPFEQNDEFGGLRPDPQKQVMLALDYPLEALGSFNEPSQSDASIKNTTIGIVATDLQLTKSEALRVAMAAQDGLARAIRPVHTPLDGDSLYVVSTGAKPMDNPIVDLARLSMLAADCVARAIARAVFEATSLGIWKSYHEKFVRS